MKPYEGMAAILYARVSTDDKGQNPQQQLEDMRRWCSEKGVEIVAEYVDEGRTGANMQRPGMMQLLGHVVMGGASMVLAQHPDRLSRDAADLERFRTQLRTYGVVIRYTMYDIAPETGAGQLINYVHASQGEEWLRDHSLKVRKGMRYRQLHGPAPGKKDIGRPKADIDDELVMECADAGYSMSKTAITLDYKRPTLIAHLRTIGRYEEYYHRCQKTPPSENTDSLNTKAEKREDF